MQEVKQLCNSREPQRPAPADLSLPSRLRHLQAAVYHFTVVKTPLATFVQSEFAPVVASRAARKEMLQDCMRMHASMWQATATASGAPHNYAAGQLCCRIACACTHPCGKRPQPRRVRPTTMLQDNYAAGQLCCRTTMLQDCMRMHASMWQATAALSGTRLHLLQ